MGRAFDLSSLSGPQSQGNLPGVTACNQDLDPVSDGAPGVASESLLSKSEGPEIPFRPTSCSPCLMPADFPLPNPVVSVAETSEVANLGMLIPGAVNGVSVRVLVDTGAALSLLSSAFASRAGLPLEPVPDGQNSLVGADGKPLECVGDALTQLSLGDANCLHRMRVVRDLQHDCIVGRDVLSHIPCTITSGAGRLFFSTQPANVSTVRSTLGSLRLCQAINIPPRHEVTAPGQTQTGWSFPACCRHLHGCADRRSIRSI